MSRNAKARKRAKVVAKEAEVKERVARGVKVPTAPRVLDGTHVLPGNYCLAEDHKKKR